MFSKQDKVYIVAEIGGNFTDYDTAKLLIDQAKESGADAVKLQTYQARTLASKKAMFDMENTGVESQEEYFKKYELDETLHIQIFDYAKKVGIDIFSTPSHITDVNMLERIGVDVYKIGADDLTNIPFLQKVARLNKPIMLSTGMGTLQEVRDAVNAIVEEGNDKISIMHVVSLYPTAAQYVNLNVIKTLKKEFPEYAIGYSDHTLGVDSCLFAAVLGAEIIEKHFTYDKKAEGPDHMLSATKEELKYLVDKIRLYEMMCGTGIKMPVGDEVKNKKNNRKSLIVTKKIAEGELLTEENVDIMRPGTGIAPKHLELVLGKRASHNLEEDRILQWSDLC